MSTIDAAPVDVILRDGSTLRLRPPGDADRQSLVRFFEELSERSLYLRFHGRPTVDERLVEPVLDPDWVDRGALLGSVVEGGEERIVALANYVRLRDPLSAEVAFAVADAYQGHGIGTRLLEQLAALAASHGVERFIGEVMADNTAMIHVFEGVGFEVTRTLSGGEVEMAFPIAPTADYDSRVAERDHVSVVASLRPFFEPRSVAVLGASPRRGTIGGELFRNILAGEFTGPAYPVNRNGDSVAAVRGYSSIADIPDPVDLAVVCVPAAAVLETVASALDKSVRAICVISAGFAEVGAEGEERQRALLALVRAHGARLLGPNCLGISSAAVRLDATFASRSAPAGNIGFSSQSGALGLALLEATESRGLGLSAFVSIGNKADVSSNDLLEWWEDDPATEIVLLYLESFGNPRTFAKAGPARRAAEADSRRQERDDCDRRSSGELAYGCACRLRDGGRRALPPSGRHTGDVARGARRRGDAALGSADAEGSQGGRADECGRTRDPLCRRVRGGTARASRARRADAPRDRGRSSPMRRAWPTRSTCSVPRRTPRTSPY